MSAPFKVGDLIRLTKMDNDPNPIPLGTKGRITSVSPSFGSDILISVDWEISRSLSLIWPKDKFDIIKEDTP